MLLFRQLFDYSSFTYTYLIGSRQSGEALIIDPVLEQLEHYLRLLQELELKLVKAIDTHVHADHVTALGALRDRTKCITLMGKQSGVDVVSMRVADGDEIAIKGVNMKAMHTPGHTDDSYCFLWDDRVFTGDTLLIRGTGRTDFQNGDPYVQYDSLFNKLLTLPDETYVYPAHDYKGDTVSTIGEEKAHNPRLQVKSVDEYVQIMNNLNLANPKMMDVAVPANLHIGLPQEELEARGWSVSTEQAVAWVEQPGMMFVDLRDQSERLRDGVIPGSVHTPYPDLEQNLKPGGLLRALASGATKRVIFYCAYGERSAMAVQTAQDLGLSNACHITGGIDAWKREHLTLQTC